MHKYYPHAYIVDISNNNAIISDLGEYEIIIQKYTGTSVNGSYDDFMYNLRNNLEDYSNFGGSFIVPNAFGGESFSKLIFPKANPIYMGSNISSSNYRVKLLFSSGDYMLGQSFNTSSAGTLFNCYDSNNNLLYGSVRCPGYDNNLNNPASEGGNSQFRMLAPEHFTSTGFDTTNNYADFRTSCSRYTSYYYIYSEHNEGFYRFLNRQTPGRNNQVTYDLIGCTGDENNPSSIPENATVTNLSFTPDSGYAFNSGSCWIDGDGYPSGTPIQYAFDPETGGLRIGPISSDITVHVHSFIDPYNNPDNPDLIDGESDIPNADTISVPSLPGIGAVSSGMIGLFNPTASQMQLLADYMWTDFGGTGSTTEDILKEIVQAIKRSISNPLDYVIGLNIIPSQGLSVGSSTSVRFGFVNSNVSMPRLTSQYFVVDCGSLSFDKLCGDTFLDYAPYSKFSLYLPYIGVKDMDANDFVGHTISILYHGDVVTGGVTAYVLKDGSVMYQYSGCCALTVPLNADSWGTTISGAIQIATTLIGGHALSSAGKGFAAKRADVMAATGAANIASNPSLLSPQVMRSGAISGGAGCMASQKPFVIREAVRFHTTEGYNTITGYPSYYYRPLSSMHGFTSVLDVHLHGVPGTHQELAEIEDLLKEGVIL